MKKRFVAVAVSAMAAVLLVALCGCTGPYDPNASMKESTVEPEALHQPGTLVVGVDASSYPFAGQANGEISGIDVDILRRYNRQKLRGSAGYALALLRALAGFRFCDFDEERGGGRIPHSAFIACAGNGQRCGGGITLCPEARIDDGLLDIVIVDGLKKRQIPRGLAKLMQKRLTDLPGTVYRRDSALRVRARAPLPIQIDGEIYEDVPFDVRVVSGELRMFRP